MEQQKKRAQFSDLSKEQQKIIAKKCFYATIECEFRGNLIKQKYAFASSQFIISKAEYYYENFASENEKIKYVEAKNKYELLSESNGIYYRENTVYQRHIEAISKIDDMEELEKYIKGDNPSKRQIPIHSLNLAVSDRMRALGDPDGIYTSVREKLKKYDTYKYNKRVEKNQAKSNLTLEENKLVSKLTLEDFIDSEYIDKKDYCYSKNLSINSFEKRVSTVKEYDPEYYEEYKKSLEEKKIEYYGSLKPVVEEILGNITTNKDYNIIDYYIAYSDLYRFNDLCESCNMFKLDIRALKTFFSRADVKSSLTLESFIDQYYCAYGHEFSDQEKQQIYDYAKDKKIPFNGHNVSLLVSRHFKNKNPNMIRN